ncbi:uncharacterized protein LOC131674354 isoform X2 [Phymastichus coffea]|uniref:uncharacterized protein LOC131674354 isoform X2 n=1 Tax=Phymastichus coffea TaxID=108790 RepID=UPI00273B55CA|nr:uncharacterized protein LOC131674354 isoform X2 [Phymastichus coffea]
MHRQALALLVALLAVGAARAVPKYEDGGFKPSAIVDYADKAAKSQDPATRPGPPPVDKRAEETARFGFNGVGDSGGYGVASYAPARIDLGGLLLGAVIGIGTILVIPKLLYVLSGSYGAYARSDEGGVAQLMSRLDDALAGHGIDTTSCTQRLLCSYAKQAAEAVGQGRAGERLDSSEPATPRPSQLDRLVDAISSNQMLNAALAGTAVQEAISAGRSGHNCQRLYRQCAFSADGALAALAKLATAQSKSTTPRPSS